MTPRTPRSRLLAAALIATALLAACPKAEEDQPPPPERRLRVLFTTDEHSHLNAVQPELQGFPPPATAGSGALVGGVATRAAENRADGVDTVTVSTGDWSQGTLASAAFAVANFDLRMMGLLGYDAVGLGNHEFDLGPRGLEFALLAAVDPAVPFPPGPLPVVVASNVQFSATSPADDGLEALFGARDSGQAVVTSHVVQTPGGIRVGFVAAIGPGAAGDAGPTAAPVRFTGSAGASDSTAALAAIAGYVQPLVDELRGAGQADVVVLLGHGGVGGSPGSPGDDEKLAQRLTGVDLVVSGHTHRQPDAVRWVNDREGRRVPVMQPAPYGRQVGQAELVLRGAGRAVLDEDPARTRFIDVDDRVLPSGDPVFTEALATVIGALETGAGSGPSFLEATLTAVEAAVGLPAVTDEPTLIGDLYFYPLGSTEVDVLGRGDRETAALDLDTDALLSAASALAGPTTVALQAAGAIRGDLLVGTSGTLAFADVYRMVPLGVDPTDGTPGYPLVRFHLPRIELLRAFEGTLQLGAANNDYFVSPAGLAVQWDPSAPAWDPNDPYRPGHVRRIAELDETGAERRVWFDAAAGGWKVPSSELVPVATTYQVAAFGGLLGIQPRAADGSAVSLPSTIVRWPGSPRAVKDHQALAAYVRGACLRNGGLLPAVYGAPQGRMACTGPACP